MTALENEEKDIDSAEVFCVSLASFGQTGFICDPQINVTNPYMGLMITGKYKLPYNEE